MQTPTPIVGGPGCLGALLVFWIPVLKGWQVCKMPVLLRSKEDKMFSFKKKKLDGLLHVMFIIIIPFSNYY